MPLPPDASPPVEGESPLFGFDGFVIDELTFRKVERAIRADGEERPKIIEEKLNIGGTININQERGRAEVALDVEVVPDPKWKPYFIKIAIVGRFTRAAGTPEQFDQFCRLGAPSILFPYVRETIHRATMDGRYGVVRLRPFNIQALMATSWQESTRSESVKAISEPSEP